jgi:hypothetical protein
MPTKTAPPSRNSRALTEAIKSMDEGMKRMRDSRPDSHGEIIQRKREEQRIKQAKSRRRSSG